MQYEQGDPHELKHKFWKAISASPYVMLQLDHNPDSAAPMTAQLDEDADHAIWFFTSRSNHFAAMGPATATFASKGHDVFARFTGTLVEETDRETRNKHWSNFVAKWFRGGTDAPDMLMLRMNLGHAAIWAGEIGALNTVKMALGMDVTDTVKGAYAETDL